MCAKFSRQTCPAGVTPPAKPNRQGTRPARPIARGSQPLYLVHQARPVVAPAAIRAMRLRVVKDSRMKYTAVTSQKQRRVSVRAVRLKTVEIIRKRPGSPMPDRRQAQTTPPDPPYEWNRQAADGDVHHHGGKVRRTQNEHRIFDEEGGPAAARTSADRGNARLLFRR